EAKLNENKELILLGKSGYGKTTLAKGLVLKYRSDNKKCVWLDASILEFNFETHIGLRHQLNELSRIADNVGLVVVDSLERITKLSSLQNLAALVKIFLYQDSPWKLIFTCQTEDFEPSIQRLRDNNLNT